MIHGLPGALLNPSSKNEKKMKKQKNKINPIQNFFLIFPQKNVFLIFQEISITSPNLKNSLVFSKKIFLIFWEKEKKLSSPELKKRPLFQEWIFQTRRKDLLWKNVLYFEKWKFIAVSLKTHIFLKQKFLTFQEGICKAWKS